MGRNSKRAVNKGRVNATYTYARPTRDGRNSVGNSLGKHINEASHAHALVNPFSVEAKGAKIPDDDSTRSVAFQTKYAFNVGSSANGVAAANIPPDIAGLYVDQNTGTTSQVTNWDTPVTTPDYTSIAANFSEWRIVSWGVRITPILAPTDQKGYIRLITSSTSPTSGTMVVTGGFFEEVEDFPVANADIYWISKPIGNEYKRYLPIGTAHAWENLTFFIAGLPASTAGLIRIEVVMNIEAQMKLGTIAGPLSTPAADHAPRVMHAADHARNRLKNAHQASHGGFMSKMWGMAKQGLIAAAEHFGPPIVGRVMNAFTRRDYQPRILAPPQVLEVN